MGRILSQLPKGENVGLAFSGGLDTCTSLAWMRERGAIPFRSEEHTSELQSH